MHKNNKKIFESQAQRDKIAFTAVYLRSKGLKERGIPSASDMGSGANQAPKDGNGKCYYPNGSMYEGEFKDGEQHGQGVASGAGDGQDAVARVDSEPSFKQEVILPHLRITDELFLKQFVDVLIIGHSWRSSSLYGCLTIP